MRRKRQEEHGGSERWQVSYSDFVTLLFAFFVVMYAVSQSGPAKARELADSMKHAFQEEDQAGAVNLSAGLMPSLRAKLRDEIGSGELHVARDARGIVISLSEGAFFPSGLAAVYPSAWGSIAKIAAVLRDVPYPIRLEGHTDSIPIHNSRFRNNFELSSARGIAVLELLGAQNGIPLNRLTVAGLANNFPLAGNDTEEGRARNRRVDIVIVDEGQPTAR